MEYIIKRFTKEGGVLLDPFAGVGTALFEARELGWDAIGIELLPVGFFLMDARLAAERVGRVTFRRSLARIEGMDWKACIKGGAGLSTYRLPKGHSQSRPSGSWRGSVLT